MSLYYVFHYDFIIDFIFTICREKSTRDMLIVKEREEMRKKILQSEIDSVERKLQYVIEFNAAAKKKLFDIW